MLIKALGCSACVEPDVMVKGFVKNDILLMCSDGLTNMVEDEDIFNIIKGYNGSGKVLVSGQSAGAWMGAMLMLDKKYLESVNLNVMDIAGWIIESGQMTSHFNVLEIESKLNPLAQRIDERAPIYFVNENTKFNSAIFFYYDNDMPMRKLQNLLLEETVKRFNPKADIETKELPGTHCYGSSFRVDGEYRYVKESLIWLKKKGF